MADQKHRLRKVMRKCRAALSSERALALSRSVQIRAIALDCYRRAAAVLLYAAVNNEVATTRSWSMRSQPAVGSSIR